jgi:hypothetical protein
MLRVGPSPDLLRVTARIGRFRMLVMGGFRVLGIREAFPP